MLAADRFLQGSRDEQLNSSSQSPQSTENLSHRLAAKSPAGLQALSAVLTPPPARAVRCAERGWVEGAVRGAERGSGAVRGAERPGGAGGGGEVRSWVAALRCLQ